MDWMNERYVRVYTRNTDDWIALSWQARALFILMLRECDRSGVIQTKRGALGVAAMCLMPAEVVATALPELVADGCIQPHASGYVIHNYIDAQEATKSDAYRQRESRQRRAQRSDRPDQSVTKRDGLSRAVTDSHEPSRDVTLCSAVPCFADPLPCGAVPAPAPARDPGAAQSAANGNQPALDSRVALGDSIWASHRARYAALQSEGIATQALPLALHGPGRQLLADRLLELQTGHHGHPAQSGEESRVTCEHVLQIREAEARSKRSLQWFGHRVWEPAQFRAALSCTVDDYSARIGPKSYGAAEPENWHPEGTELRRIK